MSLSQRRRLIRLQHIGIWLTDWPELGLVYMLATVLAVPYRQGPEVSEGQSEAYQLWPLARASSSSSQLISLAAIR